ncbi:MAG: aminomethyl-transferring glycine dehydrogenase subunit GcvPB [Alphaproteobacteria bacterium]|jgi:glycine dehydrogenase subunit 2|nr:aminomethyl-transferring glycine dehydrogenase subunit GcvPB [Alphaproteobacteria bacterium]
MATSDRGQDRKARPGFVPDSTAPGTLTGNRALDIEEPLIFEQDADGRSGVDLPEPEPFADRLGGLARADRIGLPGLSEPQVMRHFSRISRNNFGIDSGLYPLGSCTMKHNPRLNERLARLPGFADIHPLQPDSTVQGALALIDNLAEWLKTLTGMAAVAMSPAAGAQGELCGLMAIRGCLQARGDARRVVLVPDSAHGTNPATAHTCGYAVESVPSDSGGRVDLAAVRARLGGDVAAIMLTNPNTCGLFERDILAIAQAVHDAGALFYCDGANFNALIGRVRPADLGIDIMHLNLHKTFSTPHGGGGPGAGPVVMSAELAPYAPLPWRVRDETGYRLIEQAGADTPGSLGRLRAFHGQIGMFVRALAYLMSHGADGLRQVAEDAVLNANYVMARLDGALSLPYAGPCMHEVLFDDKALKESGVTTLDIAKALIDEGFHPMTVYFPLVVHGAMLIEPTETETRDSLDEFADALIALVRRAQAGDTAAFHNAPRLSPRRRLDETRAAREPVLRWRPPAPKARAAE